MTTAASINAHYGLDDLTIRVREILDAAFGARPISWNDLAPLDQFHVGGLLANQGLAAELGIKPDDVGLDVGCGLGGPARYLAATFGCTVTGIDLNSRYIELASMLTSRTGLESSVSHRVADALELPFERESFDFAWTQHVAMNIKDRVALYSGIRRVLRPGGRLAIYDVVARSAAPIVFPVPWARHAEHSFLYDLVATRTALEDAGWVVRSWSDVTEHALTWQREQATAAQGRPDALKQLALPLVMGPDFWQMVANLAQNLREGRAGLLQAIVERPV